MSEHVFERYLEEQGHGSPYPFADTASLMTRTKLPLDRDLFLDLHIQVNAPAGRVGLRQLILEGGLASFVFGDDLVSARARGWLILDGLDRSAPTTLAVLVDPAGRTTGLAVFDTAKALLLNTWPQGTHEFAADAAELVARALAIGTPRGLETLLVSNGTVSGDIWLIGDVGVVLSWKATTETVRIDVVGEPLHRRLQCDPEHFDAPRFVQELVLEDRYGRQFAITPDEQGNIELVPTGRDRQDTVLRIRQGAGDASRRELIFETLGPSGS
jgi:hypothetical protein